MTGAARPHPAGAARAARISFLLAGVTGLLIVAPGYFLEERVGRDYPPAITHPELYYGFIGVAIAWQVAFLFIGSNPVRFRPLMIAAMIEKYSYGIAVALLYSAHRVPTVTFAFGMMDLAWGVVFLICYVRLSGA